MHVCVDKLVVKILGSYAGCEFIRNFIVKSVEDWFDSFICEALAACITPFDEVVCSHALDWFSQDGVGVTVVQCEDTAVALIGSPGEHAREVCACQSFQFFKFKGIDCHLVASVKPRSRWVWWFFLSEDWIGWRLCGSDVLSGSLDPAQDGWD